MLPFLIALIALVTIAVIAYPLFFQKLTPFDLEEKSSADFNEKDALLAALTDLEEEYQLGRLSEKDYQHLKLHFQRRYLEHKKSDSSPS